MTIKSWKLEFYPITALDLVRSGATWVLALEHSLLKWKGLRAHNLEKHGCRKVCGISIRGAGEFYFNGESCALCHLADPVKGRYNNELCDCKLCQIHKVTGQDCDSAWLAFVHDDNPNPMIALLVRVIEQVKKEVQE